MYVVEFSCFHSITHYHAAVVSSTVTTMLSVCSATILTTEGNSLLTTITAITCTHSELPMSTRFTKTSHKLKAL